MKITVDIERLVLHGFSANPRERAILQGAVETELARLLAEGARAREAWVGGAAPHAAGSQVQLRAASPQTAGVRIARSMYEAITGAQPAPAHGEGKSRR